MNSPEMKCVDKDECGANVSPCHLNADCTNTDGAYFCSCATGYFGDGKIQCDPLEGPECPEGQYKQGPAFGDCAPLPINAEDGFHFK